MGDDSGHSTHLRQMEQYKWYQIRTNADGNVIEALPAERALDVYNAATGASRFVKDYKFINWTVEQAGVDTVLYITEGGPNNTATNGFNTELEVKGNNTLAVTNQQGSGLHFTNDVNVVLQYWNRDKQEKDIWAGEGIDDLKDMVDIVNANNETRGDADYFVSALIENGFATSIVIYDSYNNYKRPGTDKPGVTEGNVSLEKDNAVLANRVADLTGNTSVSSRGTANWSFTITAPEWAADTATVSVKYDLYVNDVLDTVGMTGSGTLGGGQVTLRSSGNNFQAGDKVTIVITEVTYSAVKVEVKDDKGNDIILDSTAASDVLTASTTTAAAIKFTVDTTKYDNATTAKYTVAGLTTTPAEATGVDRQQTISSALATGNSAVTITVTGLTLKAPTYSVTVNPSTLTSTGVALSKFGITSATDKNTVLKVSLAAAVAGKPEGYGYNTTGVKVELDAKPTDVYAYKITIADMGSVVIDGTYSGGTKTPLDTDTTIIYLTEDVKITQDMITVEAVENIMAVESATWTSNTVTIKFTENVKAFANDAAVKAAYTFAAETGHTNASVVESANVNGKTVTITFSGDALEEGNSLTVVASKTISDKTATNTASATKLTLGADGKVTLP